MSSGFLIRVCWFIVGGEKLFVGPRCGLCPSLTGPLCLATPTYGAGGLTVVLGSCCSGMVSARRTLSCVGWGDDIGSVGLSEEAVALDNGVKRQVVNLLKAVRLVMRSTFGVVLFAVHGVSSPCACGQCLLTWAIAGSVGRSSYVLG